MVGHQQVLYRYAVFSGFLHAGSKHITAQHVLAHQAVIFGSFAPLRVPGFLQALANGNAQRFAQLPGAVFFELGKGLFAAVVDDLQYAAECVAVEYRHHQHLPGAIAGAFVDFLQKGQARMDFFSSASPYTSTRLTAVRAMAT